MKFQNVHDPPMTEEKDVIIPYAVIAIDERVFTIQTTIDKCGGAKDQSTCSSS
jgi:hypothetical protein